MSLRAVLWKEWREQWWHEGPRRQLVYGLIMGAFFSLGAALAFSFGTASFAREFDEPEISSALRFMAGVAPWLGSGFAAVLTPLSVVLDAIAGERERHTWETLLAKPISMQAVVGGKVLAMVLASLVVYSTGILGVLVVPFLVGPGALIGGILGAVGIGFGVAIGAFAFAASGLWLSRRARTVKEGQQKMALFVMPVSMAPAMFPILAISINPIASAIITASVYGLFVLAYLAIAVAAFTTMDRDRMVLP